MKYQVGDRVKIKSFDWFRNGACIGFSTLMSKYCGAVLTIQSKNNTKNYYMKEDGGQFYWTDDMIECAMNISKLGTAANPVEPKLNANCLTQEKVDQLATKIDKELPSGNQNVWELPDGYQFVDEDGNVINATKIALEKKKTEYPKTYEECCKILGILNVDLCFNADYRSFDASKEQWKRLGLMNQFYQLLICRDAYWKIAGEEMGLGKPWEPDWKNSEERRYCIVNIEGDINLPEKILTKWILKVTNKIFVFPTEEMRDTFYENFKELIEICKELL